MFGQINLTFCEDVMLDQQWLRCKTDQRVEKVRPHKFNGHDDAEYLVNADVRVQFVCECVCESEQGSGTPFQGVGEHDVYHHEYADARG